MEKWADFVVSGVKYNTHHTAIVEVETRSDNGDTISTIPQRMTRQTVVDALVRGTTFVTTYLQNGQWKRGENVRPVTIHGQRFIRTDDNWTKADNLGSLPEYT